MTFQETATGATQPNLSYCSPDSVNTQNLRRQAVVGGVGAVTPASIVVPAGFSRRIAVMFEINPGSPAAVAWLTSSYTVRLHVSTGDPNILWDDTFICRVNGAVSQGSIGSLISQGLPTGPGGILSMSIVGSAQAANAGDLIEILLAFTNLDGVNNHSFSVISDSTIDIVPIDSAGGGVWPGWRWPVIPWQPWPTPDEAQQRRRR